MAERVGALLGARPLSAFPAQGGYTHALRVVLRLDDGRACFAKLATDDETADWLRAEARVYGAVQAGFLPRLLAWDDDGSRPLLLLEDLSAAAWPPPWSPERVERLRETLARVARTPVPAGLPALETIPGLRGWSQVAADPAPFLGLGLCSSGWLESALPALVAAEAAAPLGGEALLHLDVRSDNVCFRPEPALVDWNWAARGDARVDLAFWAPSLRLEGGPPPEALLPDEPGLAAWVSGFFAARAGLPAGPPPPRVRALQRAQLSVALPWAARALGLAPPDLASAGSSGTMASEEAP